MQPALPSQKPTAQCKSQQKKTMFFGVKIFAVVALLPQHTHEEMVSLRFLAPSF
jgi:hypothetical protein